ncbi:MAG: 2-C-methyl-D-erythritol 4-phosphate cytidylyltransferase [Ignavibacteria bacterium]|jgi:2-C-methyl-D-erythritol 4-phosphate cytidylyltransferase
MNITCIIPAAGKGSRFGNDIPKQFLKINDIMIIEYAIRSLIDGLITCGDHVISLVIACDPERILELQDICKQYLPLSSIEFVEGGRERKDSISNAMQSLLAIKSDKLIIHDAARPFIPKAVLQELVKASTDHVCVIPTLPVSDTLKKVTDDVVEKTFDRKQFMLTQTPQIVDTSIYANAIQSIGDAIFTDDASIMEYAGFDVFCINGHEMMRKITYPYDLILSELHAFMYEHENGV